MTSAPPPFQHFLDAHRDTVLAFLLATVGPHDADDCFQETFIAALRAYPRLRRAENLRGWVLTIAHRKAMDAVRARGRRAIAVGELPERGAQDERLERVEDGVPPVLRAAAKLPPRQRAAVAHRFVAGLRYREIAELVGGTEAAARRNVHDGLDRLRKEMVE
jgi:RNA polymerase sigma factor (sigma-70 family)